MVTDNANKDWYFMGAIINSYTILSSGAAFWEPTDRLEIQQHGKYKIQLASGQTVNVSFLGIIDLILH